MENVQENTSGGGQMIVEKNTRYVEISNTSFNQQITNI